MLGRQLIYAQKAYLTSKIYQGEFLEFSPKRENCIIPFFLISTKPFRLYLSNFELLEKSLNVGEAKLNKHSVKSIKSRVLNLKEIYPDLTLETLKESILKEFEKCYSKKHTQFPTKIETTQKDFYSSDEWIFGDKKFIKLDKYSKNFNWGICEIKILKNQNKNHIKIYSDALDTDIIKNAEKFINTQQKPEKTTDKKIIEICEFYNDVLALQ